MTLEKFAQDHRVRLRRDQCGEQIVSGRAGHVYDTADGLRFGVLLMFNSPRKWNSAKKKLEAGGFTIRQDADCEGTALFCPSNMDQAKTAIEIVRARRIRQLTPQQRAIATERLQHARGLTIRPVETTFEPCLAN